MAIEVSFFAPVPENLPPRNHQVFWLEVHRTANLTSLEKNRCWVRSKLAKSMLPDSYFLNFHSDIVVRNPAVAAHGTDTFSLRQSSVFNLCTLRQHGREETLARSACPWHFVSWLRVKNLIAGVEWTVFGPMYLMVFPIHLFFLVLGWLHPYYSLWITGDVTTKPAVQWDVCSTWWRTV